MAFKVILEEYERGWGSRIDDVLYFRSFEEANEYSNKFNSTNTEEVVPDWYMVASEPRFIEKLPEGKTFYMKKIEAANDV